MSPISGSVYRDGYDVIELHGYGRLENLSLLERFWVCSIGDLRVFLVGPGSGVPKRTIVLIVNIKWYNRSITNMMVSTRASVFA